MYAGIKRALDNVKFMRDILESSKEWKNYNEVTSALSKHNAQPLDATAAMLASQSKQSSLINRVAELENQLKAIENWECQLKCYKLHEFPSGALAYVLQAEMAQDQPMHYLCAACVDKKQKTTLQPNERYLYCPSCKTSISFKK